MGHVAKIKIRKSFSTDIIFVTYLNSHSGHNVCVLQTLTISRTSLATRNWLEKAVVYGMKWKDAKMATRTAVKRADFLEEKREKKMKVQFKCQVSCVLSRWTMTTFKEIS